MRRIATYVPPLLVALFALPFILRQNSWWEWGNAYWLLERQTAYVSAHGVPTLFLHNASDAYNPFYVYYSGFTLSLLAYPAALFGAWPVFVASVVAAMVAGYLGIWWTARNLGLSPQLAILPGLTFATTPYLLSEIYGRGAWAELVAVNTAAVVLGAVTALVWRPQRARSRGPAIAALVASSAFLAGTHNITLMVSGVLLPLMLLALLPLRGRGRGPILPALAWTAAAVALGVGLTAAWLLPNVWFGPSTAVADPSNFNNNTFAETFGLLKLSNVFSPLPRLPPELPGRWLYAQAPTIVAAWSLVAFGVILGLRRRSPSRVLPAMGALLALGVALSLLIVHSPWWTSFPKLLQTVQFSYRLIPYLAMVVALAATIGLTTLRGWIGRCMTAALVAIVAVQVGAGVWIVTQSAASAASPVALARHDDLTAAGEPVSFALPGLVVQYQFHIVNHFIGPIPKQKTAAVLHIGDPTTADTSGFDAVGHVGDRMMAPVVWSPFVKVTGDARIDGREGLGRTVINVTNTDAKGRWKATVETAHPWQLTVGRLISLLSAMAIAALGLIGRRRRRRASPSPAVPGPRSRSGLRPPPAPERVAR